jgi:hypothetical protein
LWTGVGEDVLKNDLDTLVREGARRLLVAAPQAEADEYIVCRADQRSKDSLHTQRGDDKE